MTHEEKEEMLELYRKLEAERKTVEELVKHNAALQKLVDLYSPERILPDELLQWAKNNGIIRLMNSNQWNQDSHGRAYSTSGVILEWVKTQIPKIYKTTTAICG